VLFQQGDVTGGVIMENLCHQSMQCPLELVVVNRTEEQLSIRLSLSKSMRPTA